jgi:hypothetical protein
MYKIFTATNLDNSQKRDCCGKVDGRMQNDNFQPQGSTYGLHNNILSASTKVTSWQPFPYPNSQVINTGSILLAYSIGKGMPGWTT